MTLNGYFTLNFVCALVCLTSDRATFENSCVNTDKDRPILSAAQIFGRDSIVSGNITFVHIFAQVLWKGEVGSRVNKDKTCRKILLSSRLTFSQSSTTFSNFAILNMYFALNTVFHRYVLSSEARLSKIGYS